METHHNHHRRTNQDTLQHLSQILVDYFDGLHCADTDKLRRLFHPDTVLKAPGLRRTLDQWLEDVASRPVPANENQPYRFRIISLEIAGDQAMAKVECPLFDRHYIDYLGFLHEGGHWRIVTKMYCDAD